VVPTPPIQSLISRLERLGGQLARLEKHMAVTAEQKEQARPLARLVSESMRLENLMLPEQQIGPVRRRSLANMQAELKRYKSLHGKGVEATIATGERSERCCMPKLALLITGRKVNVPLKTMTTALTKLGVETIAQSA